MILRGLPVLAIAFGLLSPAGAQTTLVMRGRLSPPAGQVIRVGPEGVAIAVAPVPGAGPGASERVISWDLVARVEGPLSGEAAAYSSMAEGLWRARTRLERGDVIGAEPLLEELFPKYAGRQGPTAVVVAGGLLRCRLMEGAQTSAVPALISYVNAIGDEAQSPLFMPSTEPTAPIAVDDSFQLAPLLPPIWVNVPSVHALARSTWPLATGGDARPRAALLQECYLQASKFEAGLPSTIITGHAERDEGLALLIEIVNARIGDESQRAAARLALTARIKKRPASWVEVWCRVGLGRSLLRESTRDSQLLGIGELLEVASRLERVNPYLTGVALAEAAVALHNVDDPAGATLLRSELNDRFPGHPAIEWDQLRSWPNFKPSKPTPVLPLPRTTSDDLDTKGGSQ